MNEQVKALRLPNGYSVYIALDEWYSDSENPLDWEMGEVEFYLYGGRNHCDVFTGDKSTSTPCWEEWADKLDEVVNAFGKNARGSDVVDVMGFDWVVMYQLAFSEYPPFQDVEPWQARLLRRGVNWVNANYHTCIISRYEHGLSLYTRGGPTCRWDSGICGFAVSPREQFDAEVFTNRVDSALNAYTDWCNGEVYTVYVVNANGDCVDSCGGYIGLSHAEDGFEEMKTYWSDKQDNSLLEILTIKDRIAALEDAKMTMDDMQGGSFERALQDLSVHLCFVDDFGDNRGLLADVDHYRLTRMFSAGEKDLSVSASVFITHYSKAYMKSVLENM